MSQKVQELRGIITKSEATIESIQMAVQEINQSESLLFNQIVVGSFDRTREGVLKQKLEQFEVSRQDKNDLLKNQEELKAQRNAAMEELMNVLRVENGLPEIKGLVGDDIPEKKKPNQVNKQIHPGTIPPTVRR